MTTSISIGGQVFQAVKVIDLTKSADVPEHRVEEQFEVSDHIILKPAEFKLQLTLNIEDGEPAALDELYSAKELVTLVVPAGSFTDMAIKQVTTKDSDSLNVRYATVQLMQVRKAQTRSAPVNLSSPLSISDAALAGGTAAQALSTATPDSEPEKSGGSWLDGIVGFLGGLLGGS